MPDEVPLTPENAREQIAYLDTWGTLLERDKLAWGLLRHNRDYRREWGRAFRWLHENTRKIGSAGHARTKSIHRFLTSARLWEKGDVACFALYMDIDPRAFRSLQALARRWRVHRLEDPDCAAPTQPVFIPKPSRDKPPKFELGPVFVPEPPPEPTGGSVTLRLTPKDPWVPPASVPFEGVDVPAAGGSSEALWLNLWIRLDRSQEEILRAVTEACRVARKQRAIRGRRGKRPDYAAAVRVLPLVRAVPQDWEQIAVTLDGQHTSATWSALSRRDRMAAVRAAKVRVREVEKLVAERWWEPLLRGA